MGTITFLKKSNRNKPSAKAEKVTINGDLLQRLRILLYWDQRQRDRSSDRLMFTSLGIRTNRHLKLGLTQVSTTWDLSHRTGKTTNPRAWILWTWTEGRLSQGHRTVSGRKGTITHGSRPQLHWHWGTTLNVVMVSSSHTLLCDKPTLLDTISNNSSNHEDLSPQVNFSRFYFWFVCGAPHTWKPRCPQKWRDPVRSPDSCVPSHMGTWTWTHALQEQQALLNYSAIYTAFHETVLNSKF